MKSEIISWFSNTRFYVLVCSFLLSIAEYGYIVATYESRGTQVHNLVNVYAFTAIIYLYLALIAGPFAKITRFSWRGKLVHARRAIGVSAFYFSALHVRYTFFDILGGFTGIISLPTVSLAAVLFGVLTLLILFLMAITSFDKSVEKMTFPRWKRLHQCVYLAGVAIFFHASIMGSHFVDKTGIIPVIYYAATAFLVFLHGYGLYRKRKMMQSFSRNKENVSN